MNKNIGYFFLCIVFLVVAGCASRNEVSQKQITPALGDLPVNTILWGKGQPRIKKQDNFLLHQLEISEGELRSLAFSADNRYLITGTQDRSHLKLTPVRVWNVKTGELANTFRGRGKGIFALATAPARDIVATAGLDCVIWIWNFKTGKILRKIKVPRAQNIRSLEFSPSGDKIACGTYGKSDKPNQVNAHYVWEIESKKIIHSDTSYPHGIEDLDFSPTGRILAAAHRGGDQLELWDIRNDELLPFQSFALGGVDSAHFFPDGRHLLICPDDVNNSAYIYDYLDHYVVKGDLGKSGYAELSDDGQKIIIFNSTPPSVKPGGRTYKVISAKTGDVFYRFTEDTFTYEMVMSPNGKKLATALIGGKVKIRKIPPVKKGFPLVEQLTVQKLSELLEGTRLQELKDQRVKLETMVFPAFRKLFYQNFGRPVIGNISYNLTENSYSLDITSSSSRAGKFKKTLALKKSHGTAREVKEFKKKLQNSTPTVNFKFNPSSLDLYWDSARVTVNGKTYSFDLISDSENALVHKLKLQEQKKDFKLENTEISRLQQELVEKRKQLEKSVKKQAKKNKLREQIQNIEARLTQSNDNGKTELKKFNNQLWDKLHRSKASDTSSNLYFFAVGIEDYLQAPDVDYSARTARLFGEAAHKILGVPQANINILTGPKTTGSAIKGYLDIMLNRIKEGDVLYFYYAGHGVPARDKPRSYILPRDAVVGSYEDKSFSLRALYRRLSQSKASRIYAFMDACFSGRASADELIFDQVAPAGRTTKKGGLPETIPSKLTVFTAGKNDQFANALSPKGLRLFGYYLVKGLVNEKAGSGFFHYVKEKVDEASRRKGPTYNQLPQLYGHKKFNY